MRQTAELCVQYAYVERPQPNGKIGVSEYKPDVISLPSFCI